jgi:hypothetical protein
MSETLALCAPALVLSGPLTMTGSERASGLARLGLIAYGLSLPIFGILHFRYHGYVAAVIPGWIPAHLAWAYGIGVAFVAAGVSILSGVQARLAAWLLGVMFGSWVVILHGPRVVAAHYRRGEWTSFIVALTMSGGAWIVAAHLEKMTAAVPPESSTALT